MKEELEKDGYLVLKGIFSTDAVEEMRQTVLNNLPLMSNTRENPSARHLAGFHRFPELEHLHHRMTSNPRLRSALKETFDPVQPISIGLTDITVNRSQPWHTDLLRGRYSEYLSHEACWNTSFDPCIKFLVYLQDGKSLKVRPGSHLTPVSLENDRYSEPGENDYIQPVEVHEGDVVLMDIRLVHRGSTEDETQTPSYLESPKILISTVFGAVGSPLSQGMQIGNSARMADWDSKHLTHLRSA